MESLLFHIISEKLNCCWDVISLPVMNESLKDFFMLIHQYGNGGNNLWVNKLR
jgi:hypothetical protein